RARATARRWALSSLHGAELLGVLADVVLVAVAAACPPLLLQPAATNANTATASAKAPVADSGPAAAGEPAGSRDILIELSGGTLVFTSSVSWSRADPSLSASIVSARHGRRSHSSPACRGRGPGCGLVRAARIPPRGGASAPARASVGPIAPPEGT